MSEVSIQKLKLIVAKVRAPNTIDGDSTESPSNVTETESDTAIENSVPIDLKSSKRRNTKVHTIRTI